MYFVDIGNSKLKFYFFKNNKFSLVKYFLSKQESVKDLKRYLKKSFTTEKIVLCSCVEKYSKIMKNLVPDIFEINLDKKIPFTINRKIETKKLGKDIIAACAANDTKNELIVSYGTVNFYAVKKNNELVNLFITPGFRTSYKALISSTDGIGTEDEKITNTIKQAINFESINTATTILNGLYWQNEALILKIKNNYFKKSIFKITVTGGEVDKYKESFFEIKYHLNIVEFLIPQGMLKIFLMNK